jgi:hypothetical protein
MLFNVNFTVEVSRENLAALREFASAADNVAAGVFIRSEAEDYLIDYLDTNGIPASVVRREGHRVTG